MRDYSQRELGIRPYTSFRLNSSKLWMEQEIIYYKNIESKIS